MGKVARLGGSLAMAAALGLAATPAMADGWRGGYGGGYGGGWGGPGYGGWHHRDRDSGVGTVLGVAALIGAVAVIASAADKNHRAAERERAARYYADGAPVTSDPRAENAAVDQCAVAARDEASRDGYYAEVRGISGTQPRYGGGWNVDGTVDQREGYGGQGQTRRFSCGWQDGRVTDVILSRDSIALR